MNIKAKHIVRVRHEDYENERCKVMPINRIPDLNKIVQMFESGQPIDSTLDRHLAYNPEKRLPYYKKGYSLVDAWHDIKDMKSSIDEANDALEHAQRSNQPVDTSVTPTPPPEQVPTE